MGLSDREYMRPGARRNNNATPPASATTWWQRLRFWLWRLWHRS